MIYSEKSMKLSEIKMKNMEFAKISEKMMDFEAKILYIEDCCCKKNILTMRWHN